MRNGISTLKKDSLIEKYGLSVCYKDKKEEIFKNDNMLVDFKQKYITVLIYNDEDNHLISAVNTALS